MPLLLLCLLLAFTPGALASPAGEVIDYLERLAELPYAELTDRSSETVRAHLVGLGAMQKVRGVWAPRDGERLSGRLERFTWRVVDGVPSEVLLDEVQAELAEIASVTRLFSCDAHACGNSAEWANRMFQQRILYGTDRSQRYRVYALAGESDAAGGPEASEVAGVAGSDLGRLLFYSSARTADRQYLHVELLLRN